jgi:hypothetical protein
MEWDEVIAGKAHNGEVDAGPGASDQSIGDAERVLGRLPSDYKLFLRRFGYASAGSNEFYGLGEGVPRYLDVVEMSLAERRDSAGFPADGVVIFNDGGGNLNFLREVDGESPVYAWFHDEPDDVQVDSPSFSEWLLTMIQ